MIVTGFCHARVNGERSSTGCCLVAPKTDSSSDEAALRHGRSQAQRRWAHRIEERIRSTLPRALNGVVGEKFSVSFTALQESPLRFAVGAVHISRVRRNCKYSSGCTELVKRGVGSQ